MTKDLRRLIKAAGLKNQKALAELLRRPHDAVRKWTSGQRKPPPEVVILLRLMAEGKITPEDVRMASAGDLAPIARRLATAFAHHAGRWGWPEPQDDAAAAALEMAQQITQPPAPSQSAPPVAWWRALDANGTLLAAGEGGAVLGDLAVALEERKAQPAAIIYAANGLRWRWPVRSAVFYAQLTSGQYGALGMEVVDEAGHVLATARPVLPEEAAGIAREALMAALAWLPEIAPETAWLHDLALGNVRIDAGDVWGWAQWAEQALQEAAASDIPPGAVTGALHVLAGETPAAHYALALEEATARSGGSS